MEIENVFRDLPPIFRAHFEFALDFNFYFDVEVTDDGQITARELTATDDLSERVDVLASRDGIERAMTALLAADLAQGARIGRDRLQSLAHDLRVDHLARRADTLFENHRQLLYFAKMSAEHVARTLSAQLETQN